MYDFLLEPFYLQRNIHSHLIGLAVSNVPLQAKTIPSYEQDTKVEVISVTGTIFRYENIFTKFGYGISSESLKQNIKAALDTGKSVLLVIDSGGGAVSGMADLCEYISSNKERIHAFVKGICASGALWIASSCGKITAEKTSLIGSLGVVVSVYDDSKMWEQYGVFAKDLVSTLSPNKRPDVTTEEGQKEIIRNLDSVADIFITHVAENRKMSKDDIVAKLEKGGLITGVEALERGVIDAIGSLQDILRSDKEMDKVTATQVTEQPTAKVDVEKEKFKALAKYRNLLTDDEFNSFAADPNATEAMVKEAILDKKVEASKPAAVTPPNDSVFAEVKAKMLEDAIVIAAGYDVKGADNESYRLGASKRLKPIIASVAGLQYGATETDFMAAMTTSDFPLLLKAGAKRIMDEGFISAGTTYEKLVNRVAHPDFREFTSVARDGVPAGVWGKIVEGGEPKKFIVGENGEVAKLESKAAAFNITRQMLINDDLGAFVGFVSDFARSANEHINECVYAFLEARGDYAGYKMADGKPLFDNAHKNKLTGSTSALTEKALGEARVAMLRQKDGAGNNIRVKPELLIVAPELLDTANRLMLSAATLEANLNSGVKNVLQGAYEVIADPELESKTGWYLAQRGAINLGYLAETGGKPLIELVNKTNISGLEYEGVIDFVVYGRKYQYILQAVGA